MCAKELGKVYDPKDVEQRLYEQWEKEGYFHAEVDDSKTPYTIVIPPPNITGQLHMGHALDNMMQDAIIRTKRMQGYSALWLPGTDHASIATEVKIADKLREEGTSKEELGREKFLERAWQWKEEYGGTIVKQLKKLGMNFRMGLRQLPGLAWIPVQVVQLDRHVVTPARGFPLGVHGNHHAMHRRRVRNAIGRRRNHKGRPHVVVGGQRRRSMTPL